MDSAIQTAVRYCPDCGKRNTTDASFCNACGHRMPALSLPADTMVGRDIDGRFKILKLLGEGGMGQVYLAEQTSMARPVALKVLSPMFGGDDRLKDRFSNEAALASRLNHPCTVVIYDFGVTGDGLMYIAMELIEGESLKGVLDSCGTMPWRRTAAIVKQICGSLQDAHDKTIIHRDLKPENIMLLNRGDEADVVKVLDFGVAKILADDAPGAKKGITAPNEIFGTPEYMSPEQARGDDMSPSTDIYSLGIIMYRMLTGELPFDGNTPIAILARHLADAPPDISRAAISPVVPPALCRIVNSCLAKKTEDRPASMRDIGLALDEILIAADGAPEIAVKGTLSEGIEDAVEEVVGGVAAPVGGVSPPRAHKSSSSDHMGGVAAEEEGCKEGAVDTGRYTEVDERSEREKTLDRLLASIQKKRDFPAVSQHISELNTRVANESTSASQLSNVILKDTSLTARLIKLANSPYYGNIRGKITMVSRAVVLMGFDAVREAALGLLLFDHLQSSDPAQASSLRDSAVAALMAAIVAKEQAKKTDGVNKEEAFICAMFHNLGRQAAIFYFPEAMGEVRNMVSQGLDEETAVEKALGVSLDELGQALAKNWDFPEQIRGTMTKLPHGTLRRPRGKEERLHHLAEFSTEVVKAAAVTDPRLRQSAFEELSSRFRGSFKLESNDIDDLVDDSLEKLEAYARNMNLKPSESELLQTVLRGAGRSPSIEADAPSVVSPPVTRSGRIVRTEGMSDNDYFAIVEQIAEQELQVKEKLFEEGMAEVAASIRGRFDLNGVMLMVLETMYRGLGLNRVVFCLHDVRTKTLRGRFGFGENVDDLIPNFHFPVRGRSDVFTNAMSSGEDAVILNHPDKPLALKIPIWYRNIIDAPLFLLYPIRVKQFPAALFYGDLSDSNEEISPVLMEQMRLLRNEAHRAMEAANTPKTRGRR